MTPASEPMVPAGVKIRFLLVGAWNTLFGYGIFWLLDDLFSERASSRRAAYMSAMILSNIIAVLNSFICHKAFTFRSKVRGGAMFLELVRFSATYVLTFILSLFLLPLFVEVGGFSPKGGGAMVLLSCTVVSYLGHSRFSFRKAQTP